MTSERHTNGQTDRRQYGDRMCGHSSITALPLGLLCSVLFYFILYSTFRTNTTKIWSFIQHLFVEIVLHIVYKHIIILIKCSITSQVYTCYTGCELSPLHPSTLNFRTNKINNWNPGHVNMTKGGRFWCIR